MIHYFQCSRYDFVQPGIVVYHPGCNRYIAADLHLFVKVH